MGVTPEIVELDCQRHWRKSRLPEEIQEDMRRCNRIWVSFPKIPDTPRMNMEWQWGWRDWKWREGPSIPKQAQFELMGEATLPDKLLESLRLSVEEQIEGQMRDLCEGISFAVFLCLHERYVQGLQVEEGGCMASLVKSYVLLGRGYEKA